MLYTCAWSTDISTNEPLVVFAGLKGLIRCLVPFKNEYKNVLIGHGSSVNDLRFHPTKYNFLLSASKDYTLRLWNVNNNICVAIFGGAEGHCDEVLNAVWDIRFISALFQAKFIRLIFKRKFPLIFLCLKKDFNLNGTKIMSCSIDHHLKMWNIQTAKIQKAMDESENFKVKNKWVHLIVTWSLMLFTIWIFEISTVKQRLIAQVNYQGALFGPNITAI